MYYSPHPILPGSLHEIASRVSFREFSIGQINLSWLSGKGLTIGFIRLAWWLLAGESLCLQVTSRQTYEIKMDGEEDKLDNNSD